MSNLFFYGLGAIGLSYILAYSTIAHPVKVWLGEKGWLGAKLVQMLNCTQCNGFWSGMLAYLAYLSQPYLDFLVLGFIVSLASPILWQLYECLIAWHWSVYQGQPQEEEQVGEDNEGDDEE